MLEIAQNVFDSVRTKRTEYLREIRKKEAMPSDFLSQPIDFETLMAYSRWKFPKLTSSATLTLILLRDLDLKYYPSLYSINASVEKAKLAIEAFRSESPDVFTTGTDFITKSLGFTDPKFRTRHGFSRRTRELFDKHEALLAVVEASRYRG